MIFCAAIEKLFWAAKSRFTKRLMSYDGEMDEDRFRQLVMESLDSIPTEKILRLCKSNRKFVAKMLHVKLIIEEFKRSIKDFRVLETIKFEKSTGHSSQPTTH